LASLPDQMSQEPQNGAIPFATIPTMIDSHSHDRGRYRLFGSVGSPYALKLRALMRYQRVPFDWVPASLDWVPDALDRSPLSHKAREEILHIHPPVIPVVYFAHERAFRNDSTAVAYELDAKAPSRAIVPPDPGIAFLSHLIEDMADEWGVKIAFHYRWGHAQDSAFKSRIVVGELLGGGFDRSTQIAAAKKFADRQIGRMPLVGSTSENAPLIIESFRRVLAAFDHVEESATFIFGPRPVLADFGWYGQLVSLATDPTPWAFMREHAPGVFAYLQLLEDASGIDEEWPRASDALPPAVAELLRVAGDVYLPFLKANAEAFHAGARTFSFSALGMKYSQDTFKYQVKCLQWLRDEVKALRGEARDRTFSILRDSGCLDVLVC
jgi:glutathione S-transferase